MARITVVVISCKKSDCDKSGNFILLNKEEINEHLSILKGQGITNLVVAVNKMDTVKWS
jgi:translation elongation factor EF-1alpha